MDSTATLKKLKSLQQNSFVGHIFLALLKFSCNYGKMVGVIQMFLFFQINYFIESFG